MFPKEQFAYPAWLPLLRDVGLVHRVTPPALAAAAEAVAGRAAALHMAVTAAAAAEGGGGVPDVASLDGEAQLCTTAVYCRLFSGALVRGVWRRAAVAYLLLHRWR